MKNAKLKMKNVVEKLIKVKKNKMIKRVKNTKSETLNSKQYRNPNAQNRKEEKGLGHLKFDNLNLFRIWDLEFRICNIVGKVDALQLCIALPARNHSQTEAETRSPRTVERLKSDKVER